tara:strand:- start:686 stop:1732 length:1047 start_codon:yes stop_codon:yes gene_type:complete
MNRPLNIIYVSTTEKGPSGGVKIIYDHSEQINRLNLKNITSEILNFKKKKISKWKGSFRKVLKLKNTDFTGWSTKDVAIDKNFRSSWFKNKVKVKTNMSFNKEKDFIIFPEIFSHFAKKFCIDKKIPYGIFALNGYTLKPTNDYKTLEEVYKKAKIILSISDDISKCVKLAFPTCENKILKVGVSLGKNFNYNIKKTNLITYMPRKMQQHSDQVIFFLRKYISSSWKIKKIHNMKEHEVSKLLLQSKIFLSFSGFEGLGMPPIEAAIAGNKVIGYTGEGGKEVWKKPIFSEIPSGNILKFVEEIIKNTKKNFPKGKTLTQRKKIIKKFSLEAQKLSVIKMIKLIRNKK